jgi:hypothetical protein
VTARLRVSVLMPAHGQAELIPRAVYSLLAQSVRDWELVVIDDGSPDDVGAALAPLDGDERVRLLRCARNGGLGAALNAGLEAALAPIVAYLPCDDVLHAGHLEGLLAVLDADPGAIAAVAGHDGLDDPVLQLVQVAHRRTEDRWVERPELESDDLGLLLWDRLRARGRFAATGATTCAWTAHAGQRHRAIRESCDGGLNVFRRRYRIAEPLRFHSSETGLVDEVARYATERARMPPADGMRVVLAGELAYNPERVVALEDHGHRLCGLWIDDPLGFNTIGPLPFGGVEDLDPRAPRSELRRVGAEVVYAQLNWRAVPLAHALLDAGVPMVWHFKEAPQRSIVRGEWELLAELHERATGVIYATDLERRWFEAALPGRRDPAWTLVMDGDLPRARVQEGPVRPRLSAADGIPRLALLGRPAGADPAFLGELAAAGVELHAHGVARSPLGRAWLAEAQRATGGGLVEHPAVGPEDWVGVLSRYDGGLLHRFRSENGGDVRRATWDDLNVPARVPTLLAAGVPLVQQASPGAAVHTQDLIRATGAGLLHDAAEDLAAALREEAATGAARARALAVRGDFAFEAHAGRLSAFLRAVAATSSSARSTVAWERPAG